MRRLYSWPAWVLRAVVRYGVPSGRYRVLDVIIDVAGERPRISYLRDLTKLGMPIPITGPDAVPTTQATKPREVRRG